MSEGKYTEYTAMEKIYGSGKVLGCGSYLEVVRGGLGIKRLGALDFLVNHCKQQVVFVDELSSTKAGKKKR